MSYCFRVFVECGYSKFVPKSAVATKVGVSDIKK